MNAGSDGAVGCQMHLGAQVHGLFDESDLFERLVVALADDGFDERNARARRLCCWFHAEQFPQPDAMVATIGWQEMNGLAFAASLVEISFQLAHRSRVCDAELRSTLLQRGHRACPDDIIDRQLVAEDDDPVLVHVDDGGEVGVVHSDEIQERTVLTKLICVVGIVHAHFSIAEEQQQAAAHILLQAGTAL